MSAWEHFRAGGWAMWYVLLFGALAVSAGVRCAMRGVPALARFGRGMCRATLLASAFGFITGMLKVSQFILAHAKDNEDRLKILIEGTGEASNNLAMGLLLVTLASLLLAVGDRRFGVSRVE